MTEKRVTLEKVRGWYAECGLKPCQNEWFRRDYETEKLECCPLGAWHLYHGGDARRSAAICAANEYFGLSYVTGFIEGFDNRDYSMHFNSEYRMGYDDGELARKELFPLT